MKKYIGTKQIEAEPMTMGEAFRRSLLKVGRVPNSVERDVDGYYIRYSNGYESWMSKASFNEKYRLSDTFLDRLQIELHDLAERRNKLQTFVQTEQFGALGADDRNLLQTQLGIMNEYMNILTIRITKAKL